MYLALFACLILFALLSRKNVKKDLKYTIAMLIMTVVLCLRYGQGTDYFSYNDLYTMYSTFELAITNPYNHYMEILYRLICAFFNTLGFSFAGFVAVVSLFNMLMLNRFLKRYSQNPIFSLLLFYPTFYLTYFFSIIRQAIVLSVFLGYMVELLMKKKVAKYFLCSLIMALIHSSSVVLIAIPILLKFNLKKIYFIIACAAPIGLIMATTPIAKLFAYIPFVGTQILNYINQSISVIALLERVISFTIIWYLYKSRKPGLEQDCIDHFMKLYAFGLAIYFIFMPFPLISSRLMLFFKVFEVILIPNMINIKKSVHLILSVVVLSMTVIMYFKNIGSYIDQGLYNDSVNVFNYPYFNIFDKQEIWKYRRYS